LTMDFSTIVFLLALVGWLVWGWLMWRTWR
jgi:hypothetical protein